MEFKIEGINEIKKKLQELDETMRKDIMEEVLKAGAEPVREQAAISAPKRTGKLSERIEIEIEDESVKIGPHKSVFYGIFHEIGTYKMPAKPWLRPAMESKKKEASNAASKKMYEKIKEVVK